MIDTTSYTIYRIYQKEGMTKRFIKGGLSLKEAQAHCNDPETSSKTAKKRRGGCVSEWFDSYTNR